jgi:hypothetical protein
MKGHENRIAMFLFVGTGLAMALGGGALFNTLPVGSPWKAVALALLIVGFAVLFIWRIMRRFPRL